MTETDYIWYNSNNSVASMQITYDICRETEKETESEKEDWHEKHQNVVGLQMVIILFH